MSIPRRMAGTVVQSGADVVNQVTRKLGSSRAKFEAIQPLYFALWLDPLLSAQWGQPWGMKAEFILPLSDERIRWYASSALVPALAGSGPWHPHYEFYVPPNLPVYFEEEITIFFDTNTTGAVNTLGYVMYYDIVQKTELEMVQESVRYTL